MAVPTYDKFFNPLLLALRNLGGSGSVAEIEEEVAKVMTLSEKNIEELHRGKASAISLLPGYPVTWLILAPIVSSRTFDMT
jgi:restriction system protein